MSESEIIDAILEPLDEENWECIYDMGINHIYPSGMTALGLAIYYDQEANADFLLKKGADPNIFGKEANSPLYDAYISHSPRLFILLLMYGANPKLGRDEDRYPKRIMMDIGSVDFLDTLFSFYQSTRTTGK